MQKDDESCLLRKVVCWWMLSTDGSCLLAEVVYWRKLSIDESCLVITSEASEMILKGLQWKSWSDDRQTESISTYRLGPSIGWAEWKLGCFGCSIQIQKEFRRKNRAPKNGVGAVVKCSLDVSSSDNGCPEIKVMSRKREWKTAAKTCVKIQI